MNTERKIGLKIYIIITLIEPYIENPITFCVFGISCQQVANPLVALFC